MRSKIEAGFDSSREKTILNQEIDLKYGELLSPEIIKIIERIHPELLKNLVDLYRHHPYTFEHSLAVANMAVVIANEYGELTEKEKEELKEGIITHDLGKLEIDRGLLDKNASLSEDEFKIIKEHPEIGFKKISPYSARSAEFALDHHKFQENSYPEGAPGENKKISRIIALIDSFHTIAFGRKYQRALPLEKCREILLKKFTEPEDKKIIDILIKHFE